MGRKSNAKKNRRKKKAESKEKEIKKGFFTKLKPSLKPKKKTKKKQKKAKKKLKIKINRKKLFGWVFTLIMLAILVSVGHLLFQKAFRAQPIAKILPADRTIAFIEINTNFEHNQLLKTFNLLENQPQYSREKLIEKVEIELNLNYEKELKPWVGREIGAAILNPQDHEDDIQIVYFVEVLNPKAAEKFLNQQRPTKNQYSNQTTYKIDGPSDSHYHSTFINDYLFFSSQEKAIFDLIDDQKSQTLHGSSKYRKIDNNLPLNKVAFLYTDFDLMSDSFFQSFAILGENGLSMNLLEPFLNLFDAEGISLIAMNDNFAIQSFLSLDQTVVDKIDYLNFQEKYTAKLADYVTEDNLTFWGGENLEYQLKRIIELLAGGDETTLLVFDSLLQNYTQKYFGADTNFNEDILPLFRNEFAFVIEPLEGENIYKLLLELDSPQKDAINLHEIANSFAKVGAIFEPKIVTHTLEDGTVTKEIVAIPEEVEKSESKYKETTISELKMGQQGWGVYYALVDDIAVIATHIEGVKSTIDTFQGDLRSLRSTELFSKHIEPVLKSSDEVAYFNIEGLIPVLFDDDVAPIMKIIGSISSGRNYFNDGVVTINYLHIK